MLKSQIHFEVLVPCSARPLCEFIRNTIFKDDTKILIFSSNEGTKDLARKLKTFHKTFPCHLFVWRCIARDINNVSFTVIILCDNYCLSPSATFEDVGGRSAEWAVLVREGGRQEVIFDIFQIKCSIQTTILKAMYTWYAE